MAEPAIKNIAVKYLYAVLMPTDLKGNIQGIVIMIGFESTVGANTSYHSEEYQAAKA